MFKVGQTVTLRSGADGTRCTVNRPVDIGDEVRIFRSLSGSIWCLVTE